VYFCKGRDTLSYVSEIKHLKHIFRRKNCKKVDQLCSKILSFPVAIVTAVKNSTKRLGIFNFALVSGNLFRKLFPRANSILKRK
jgi:hypothetical protein